MSVNLSISDEDENIPNYLEKDHFPAEGPFVVFVVFVLFDLELLFLQAQSEGDVDSSRPSNDLHFVSQAASISSLLEIFASILDALSSYAGCHSIRINNATRAKIIYLHHRTAVAVRFFQLKQA
ncbi:hypothetical protein PITC_049520 [Penicillium italicum]|uniref:Uncharacterized protein n=1 Tax=Penicillium italicum TaxID=40296 RepID=A0A0A2KGT6_PENIT|nr:hypothetical protein PITC_049520 [Penicillium italicum]